MKKKSFLTLVLLCAAAQWALADNVTAEQALQQAQAFVANQQAAGGGQRHAPGATKQLIAKGQVSGLYLFNVANDGGFVIVSNDDRTTPILGYSDSGNIDPDNMPDNMRAWLQGYADEIAWLQTQNAQTTAPRRVGTHVQTAINPLLGADEDVNKIKWNQNNPYNLLCPSINQTQCVTGCVATAMAQVMYYTEKKAGNNTTTTTAEIPAYTWSQTNEQLEAIPVNSTLNWSNMLPYYTDNSSEIQKNAVATLLKYCGWSVQMNYGLGGSEAQTVRVADALKNYFGYATTTKYVSRSFYSYANWTDMIYNELSNGRPVIYGGSAVDNGHAFICDGYMYYEGDLFHINWGWGGQSDGYFALTALDPANQGIGGSSSNSGYTFCQEAIVGIQKAGNNGTVLDNHNNVDMTINSISLSRNSVGLGETIVITVNVTNNSSDAYDGDIVFKIGSVISFGANVVVPANTTQDCDISYKPNFTGRATIYPLIPNGEGSYSSSSNVYAILGVDDSTPSDLTVSDITSESATIGWSSFDEIQKWNLRSRQLTITKLDFNDGELPTGWQNIDNDKDGYKWECMDLGNNNYCLSSASNLDGVGALNPDNWLISPPITLGGSFSFWAWGQHETNYAESFTVYVSTDGRNFSPISPNYVATNTPTLYHIDLSAYIGTGYLAIIHSNSTNQSYLNIDDVTFVEPAGGWSTISNVTTNPYTLTGLTWETNYEVQVQAVYDEGTTDWSESLIFSTPNITPTDLVSIPTCQSAFVSWTGYTDSYKVQYRTSETVSFHDGFEGGTNWTRNNGVRSSGIPNSGTYFVLLGYTSTNPQYLITPKLGNLKSGSTVEFYQRHYIKETTFMVGFSKTTADLNAFTWGNPQSSTSSYTSFRQEVPFGTKYIAIQTTAESSDYALLIDDFSVGNETPAGDWVVLPTTTKSSINITGLTANTQYDYQVIGINGNVEMASSNISSFTTTDAAFELADAGSNDELIAAWDGITATVKLAGRTLKKNGQWNTLCLPFPLSADQIAASDLKDADIRTLDEVSFSGSTLTLNFTPETGDGAITEIAAGTPYIIKWANSNSDIVSPVFNNVVINKTMQDKECNLGNGNAVTFKGTYTKLSYTKDTPSILFVGENSTLWYPTNSATIGAQRAYFELTGITAGEPASVVRSIVLNFGDEETGVVSMNNGQSAMYKDVYDLQGRRWSNDQMRKGLYIRNGRKVVIK